MTDKGLIKAVLHILDSCKSSDILTIALETLSQILEEGAQQEISGASINTYLLILENCGGIKIIEKLQAHHNENVYELVEELINKYFAVDHTLLCGEMQ